MTTALETDGTITLQQAVLRARRCNRIIRAEVMLCNDMVIEALVYTPATDNA